MPFVDLAPPDLGTRFDRPEGFAVTPGADDVNHGSEAVSAPGSSWLPSAGFMSAASELAASFINPARAGQNVIAIAQSPVTKAAFRQDNTIGAALTASTAYDPNYREDGFNPWDAIKGTKYQQHWESFIDTYSTAAADAVKRKIDQEEQDRRTLEAAPWYQSVPAQMLAGVLDWPSLLPGGAFVRGAKGGYSIARSALTVGGAAGASSLAQEATLQSLTETRTAGESAFNIGASVLLGGLLGAGGAKLLNRAEFTAGARRIEQGGALGDLGAVRPVYDDIHAQLLATGMDADEAATNAAVVAARYRARAERLGADPLELYRTEGITVRKIEPPDDLAHSLNMPSEEIAARTFNQSEVENAIRAYHGSPHDFDRFDLSKIGTGEGAQAYGHGLYFAENENVAKAYRDALSGRLYSGGSFDPNNAEHIAQKAMIGRSPEEAVLDLERLGRSAGPIGEGQLGPLRDAITILRTKQVLPPASAGRMYEVNINAHPDQFLDWDKSYRQQPNGIRERARIALMEAANDSPDAQDILRFINRGGDRSSSDLYSALFNPWVRRGPDGSNILREAGIPGIKYLDQGSRGAGEGSRNYVVFDDKLIDIIRKYQRDKVGAARGAITFDTNKATIDLFSGADQSTFMHEAGHLWLDELGRDASKNAGVKADLDTTLKWLGVDDVAKIGTAEHEKWARGFEQYLREGKAPSSALEQAFASFKRWLTEIYRNLFDLGAPISDEIRGVMDRMLATDAEIAARNAGPAEGGVGAPGSVGAAAVRPASLEENTILGGAAETLAEATRRLNPNLRLNTSPSAVTRDIAGNLTEFSAYLRKNAEGVASAQSAETAMTEWRGNLARALSASDVGWKDYRKAGGTLKRPEFLEEVGRAMRRGDEHEDPHIAAVAKVWRKEVFDPLKQAAIETGQLPEDVAVATADSYFSRMWNQGKLVSREAEFKAIVRGWVEDKLPEWAAAYDRGVERRLSPLRQEIEDLEMAKLRRAEEAKQRAAGEVEPGEFTEADIRAALRIVQGGAPKPKGVQTLTQFVHQAGGLVDYSGELAHMGISNKSRPGFVRNVRRTGQNKGGWTFDDMARHAWENGFFPGNVERPTVREFLDALSDDFNKLRAVVREGDRDAYRLNELVDQLDADLARIGIHETRDARFSTSDELKGMVQRINAARDAEDARKIDVLRRTLTERENAARSEREARFLGEPKQLGDDIAREVYDSLTGRANDGVRPEFVTITARGPLKERTFNIPDALVEDFLEHNVELVGRRYARVMGADVELARKFGSPDMKDQLLKIKEDYDRLRQGVTDEKELRRLNAAEKTDRLDVESLRDLLRGTRLEAPLETNYARMSRVVNQLNYARSMGEVVPASLTDAVRPAMVHGLGQFMTDLPKFLTAREAVKMSIGEAQLAGNVLERVLGTRLATVSEIIDPYTVRSPFEKLMENMTNVASKWNGIRMWTDMMKSVASVMTQNRILANVEGFARAPAKERQYLAFLGIDQSMAERIAAQFSAHGETIDGVRVANTSAWDDAVAVRAYRAAMNKDVNSIIVERSVGDVPLFSHTPTGRMLLQFKSFGLASHQKVLLRGLQEDQTRFVGGLIAMTMMGMGITYLKSITGNRPEARTKMMENPGWWIGEGLDRSGVFSVPVEVSNMIEKAVGVNPIKSPMKAFDKGGSVSQKNQNRNELGSLLGPAAGFVQDALRVGAIPAKVAAGGELGKGDKTAIKNVIPFSSYAGVRQLLNYTVFPPE